MEVGAGKTFTLKGLAPGATYVIEVKSIPKKGAPSEWSRPIKFNTKSKDVAPPPITNLEVAFDGAGFTATWDGSAALAEKDFAYFKINLTSPDFPSITKTYASQSESFSLDYDSMLFAFGGIANPITIEVISVDRTGNESAGVSATGGNEPPAAPTNVAVVAETMGYQVSWDAPPETDYSYSKIYESSTVSGTYTSVDNVTATPSSIKVVGYDTRFIKVSHVDTFGGESALAPSVGISVTPINPVTVDTTPPDQRTSITYTAGVGQVEASWTNPTDPTNNSDIAGVTIRYARISSPSNYTWVDVPFTFAAPVTSATINGLLPLSGYNFSISTYDKTQNRTAYSTSTQVTTLADTTPPPRPVVPTVSAGAAAGGPMMVRVTQSAIEHGTSTPLPLDTYYFRVFMLDSGFSTAPSPGDATNPNSTEVGLLFAAFNGGDAQEKFFVPLLEGEQRYFYTRAVDTSGNVSDASLADQSDVMVVFSNAYISDLSADKITAGRINANEYIQVGTSTEQITIKSTSTLGQIYSGVGTYNNSNTGIYIDTAGQFSLKNRLLFDGTNLTVTGTINAKGGTFDGNVKVASPGSIYVGTSPDSGARLIMNANGLTAYNTLGNSTFTIDASTGSISLSGYLQVGGAAGDVNAGVTKISGNQIRTGLIASALWNEITPTTFTTDGSTVINLTGNSIHSPNFYIAGGNAAFLGEVRATSGYFGSDVYGWTLTTGTDPTYGAYALIGTDTLKLYSEQNGTVRNVLIQFTTSAGSVIGELSPTTSSKNHVGLGTGLVLGTTADYFFMPGTGNSNRARIYTNGLDFWGPASGFLMRFNNDGINLAGNSDLNFYNMDNSTIGASINYQPSTDYLVISSDGEIRLNGTALKFNGANVGTGGSGTTIPTGTITMYGGDTEPSGWLFCNGQSYNTSTYNALWNVIGYSYGGGGSSFNVPDFTQRFPRGGSDPNTSRGNTGGQASFTLSEENIPRHSHNVGTLELTGNSGGSGALSHSGTMDEKGGHTHGSLTATNSTQTSHSHGPGNLSTNNAGAHTDTNTTYTFGTNNNTTTSGGANRLTSVTTVNSNANISSHSHTVTSGDTGLAGNHSHTISFNWTNASAGSHRHTITVDDHASHTHGVGTLAISGSTANWGTLSPTSINNQPPYVVVNFIIKT